MPEAVDPCFSARIAWTQSLITHRIVPTSFSKSLYKRCCTVVSHPYSEDSYRLAFDEASKHLSEIDLELRNFRDQQTGTPMLALVNAKADKLIQGATRYSATEIGYVKRLVEEIFRAKKEAYAIASLEAVRLGGKVRTGLTRDATEELLKNLVDHGWVDYSTDGIYTLSTRTLLELRSYLQDEFGPDHYHACTHCKDLVTLGIGCSYSPHRCDVRYHYHCARATIGAKVDDEERLHRLAGFSCAGCGRAWKSRPIGPRALGLGTAEPSSQTPRGGSGRFTQHQEQEDEEEGDEEEDTAFAGQDEEREQRRPVKRPPSESEEEEEQVKPEPHTTPRSRRRPTQQQHEESDDEEQVDVKPRKRAR